MTPETPNPQPEVQVVLGQVWKDRRGGPHFKILDGEGDFVIVENVHSAKRQRRIRYDRLVRDYVVVRQPKKLP